MLIVDGLFLHAAAVRHKEILALLADGVAVAGCSSMGALRAAELWQFGMRGSGQVFALYRDGAVDGDDEVAIVHADEESGFRALSEPLVNLRLDLARALDAGALDQAGHDLLLAHLKSLPFRGRTLAGLARAAGDLLGAARGARTADWLREHHVDAKRADARAMLALAAVDPGWPAPAGAEDRAATSIGTEYAAAWSLGFGGREVAGRWVRRADVEALAAVSDPDFPRRYRAAVLAALAADCRGLLPSTASDAEICVERARRDGLITADEELAAAARAWLSDTEAARLPAAEAVLRALARAHGTRPATRLALLPGLVADDDALYQKAAAVRDFAELTLRGGGAVRRHLRPEAIDRFCAGLWGCETAELTAAAWDRGFPGLEHARRDAEDLVAHARFFEPSFQQQATTRGRRS